MKLSYRILRGVLTVIAVGVVLLAVALSYNSPCDSASPDLQDKPRMKAVVYRCYGPPDVLKIEQVGKPIPADKQVLVKVHAAGLNPLDWHALRGEPYFIRLSSGFGSPKRVQLGVDFAGTVEAVGSNVTRFKPGDAVFGGASGSLAEHLLVQEDGAIVHKPENISFTQAASAGIAAVTALQALRDRGALQSGQKVLINGASGGVGTFALQIANAMGAEVTGVCSTRNLELVRSLGADHVIDYTQENFTERGEQYDLVVDNVSTQSLSAIRRVLKPNGRLVIVGGISRDRWLGPLTRPIKAMLYSPFVEQEMGLLLASMNQADLSTLAGLMESGKVTPAIDREYSFGQTADGIAYLEKGHARGKVVVNISNDASQL